MALDSSLHRTIDTLAVSDIHDTSNALARAEAGYGELTKKERLFREVADKLGYEIIEIMIATGEKVEALGGRGNFVITQSSRAQPPHFDIHDTRTRRALERRPSGTLVGTGIRDNPKGLVYGKDNNGLIFILRKRVEEGSVLEPEKGALKTK